MKVLQLLVVYRLIDPGSEFRLHCKWFDKSAMAELMEEDFGVAEKDHFYRCLDDFWNTKCLISTFAGPLARSLSGEVRSVAL